MELLLGNCLDRLKELKDNSVDAIVTDPPYGISFMGKKWDYDVPSKEVWKECLRVLKPGGYLLSFAGTRTQHRMAVNIEDAGFEIRDMIAWVYGSGFPKSLNIGKAVDKIAPRLNQFDEFAKHLTNQIQISGKTQKEIASLFPSKTGGLTGCVWNWANGANVPTVAQWNILKPLLNLSDEFMPLIERIEREREVVGKDKNWGDLSEVATFTGGQEWDITKGTSEWEGWGTALKPAVESITVALKPFNTVPYYDIIEQEVKELLCQLQQLAKTVVESSKSSQVDTKGESDIAQWSAGEYTSTQEGLSVLMGMLQLESERTLSLNIVLSWLSILGEALKLESKSTIEMKISLITELRTLNSLEWGNISQSIIQAKGSQINIQNADVLTVIGLFIGLELKLKTIQEPFVVESAMLREEEKIFAPNLSPIIMSRKPIEGTVAENCLKWGVGGINIDGCRVEYTDGTTEEQIRRKYTGSNEGNGSVTNNFGVKDIKMTSESTLTGRFPANLIHDGSEEVVGLFPQTKGGGSQNGSRKWKGEEGEGGFGGWAGKVPTGNYISRDNGTGSAARFFYCAKASKRERNIGCEGLEEKETKRYGDFEGTPEHAPKLGVKNTNNHPTVKPLALMEYLVKMVSREGQVVLDPFMGSGTTGMACKKLNREFIGIEMMPEYMEIAKCRIEATQYKPTLF